MRKQSLLGKRIRPASPVYAIWLVGVTIGDMTRMHATCECANPDKQHQNVGRYRSESHSMQLLRYFASFGLQAYATVNGVIVAKNWTTAVRCPYLAA